MPRRARRLSESEIYHVMLRGINRDVIFIEEEDYERFLIHLLAAKEASGCQVLAYCLMPNHVHLVLHATTEPIGAVVKRIGVRYVAWFNRKYGRVGHLFQDRFKSLPVEDDAYLVTLLRYVWRNPIESGLADRPEDYRWSSRRLLGRGSSLIDEDALRQLVPEENLEGVAVDNRYPEIAVAPKRGRSPRHSIDEVQELSKAVCGADCPETFKALEPAMQQRVISELRMRGVTYDQLARLSGRSATSVRRVHVGAQVPDRPGAA